MDETTTYEYVGTPQIHHDDNEEVDSSQRGWGIWRGYAEVKTTKGTAALEVDLYKVLRGMHDDKLTETQTLVVNVTDGHGNTFKDYDWFKGRVYQHGRYNGTTLVEFSTTTPGWGRLDPGANDVEDPTTFCNYGRIKELEFEILDYETRRAGSRTNAGLLSRRWDLAQRYRLMSLLRGVSVGTAAVSAAYSYQQQFEADAGDASLSAAQRHARAGTRAFAESVGSGLGGAVGVVGGSAICNAWCAVPGGLIGSAGGQQLGSVAADQLLSPVTTLTGWVEENHVVIRIGASPVVPWWGFP